MIFGRADDGLRFFFRFVRVRRRTSLFLWIRNKSNGNGSMGKEEEGRSMDASFLLRKYGKAYLVSSLSLSAISFSFFYLLFNSSLDTGRLLETFHLDLDERAEKAGTVAIAYAAHKATSPIRFPPTVALTPVIAKMLGKNEEE